jgi:small subunit ribosomal protein S6
MANYETMFILRPELEAESEEELLTGMKGVIEKLGGAVTAVDDWGKRKLAYEISKVNEGHYYLLQFAGVHEIIPELEHFFKVNDEVIRFMVMREDQ